MAKSTFTRREFLNVAAIISAVLVTNSSRASTRPDQVLLVGGVSFLPRYELGAELYDATTRSFRPTRGKVHSQRAGHTATLLADGTVLIAGGAPGYANAIASAELYHPDTEMLSLLRQEMTVTRTEHTATLLRDSKVLIVGGNYSVLGTSPALAKRGPATPVDTPKTYPGGTVGPLASAELYDPARQSFVLTGSMGMPRSGHSATLLNDGQVLVAGGYHDLATLDSSALLYDSVNERFIPTGSMNFPRAMHSAVKLLNGEVLVVGCGGTNALVSKTSEIFSPRTGRFREVGDVEKGLR